MKSSFPGGVRYRVPAILCAFGCVVVALSAYGRAQSAPAAIRDQAPRRITRLTAAEVEALFSRNVTIRRSSFAYQFTTGGCVLVSGANPPGVGRYVVQSDRVCSTVAGEEQCRAFYRSAGGGLWWAPYGAGDRQVNDVERIQVERTPATSNGVCPGPPRAGRSE